MIWRGLMVVAAGLGLAGSEALPDAGFAAEQRDSCPVTRSSQKAPPGGFWRITATVGRATLTFVNLVAVE